MNIRILTHKLWTIHTAAELIMVAFAGLSLSNVEQFFHTIHPHGIASWVAGVALGSILVILAAILSRMETNIRDRGYVIVLSTTAGLTLISGLIQGAAYSHTLHWLPAYALGLSLPAFGELMLALVIAEYTAHEKRKRAKMADEGFDGKIDDAISEALADIDVSAAKRHIEKQAAAIVRHKMDQVVARRIGRIVHTDETGNDSGGSFQQISETDRPTIDQMNEQRQRAIAERHSNILHMFGVHGEMSLTDLQNRLRDDMACTVTERTLRTDLQALVDSGDLVKQGRGRWSLPMAIAALPEPALVHTNGVAH